MSAVALATTFWDQLTAWAQAGALGLTTAVLLAGGAAAVRTGAAATRRLGEVLGLLAAATLAGTLGTVADDIAGWSRAAVTATTGVGVALVHAALWRARPQGLQSVPVLAGTTAAALGALRLVTDAPTDLAGLLVWAIGTAWVVLALAGRLPPRRTALAAGGVAALVGAQWLAFAMEPGLALGLGTALAEFAVGARTGEPLLAGLAVAGVVVLLPQALSTWFGDGVTAPIALLVTGIVLLGGALATLRLARPSSSAGSPSGGP